MSKPFNMIYYALNLLRSLSVKLKDATTKSRPKLMNVQVAYDVCFENYTAT